MVALQQFADGVKRYINNNIIPHLPSNKQFAAGVALGVVASRTDKMIQNLKGNQMVQLLGLIDGDMIDDDALLVAVREQMAKQGGLQLEVPWIGTLTFNAPDVDALQRAIRGG